MTQKTRDRLCDLDEIHMKLHCSIEAVRQSWTAMTQGENEPCRDDFDGLYGIYSYLSELEKQLKACKEDLWKACM